MRFELNHLESYDDAALLDELRRVAALLAESKLSRSEFIKHAKVHSSTIEKRFGSWGQALSAAGLANLLNDSSSAYTRDELLAAIRSAAEQLGSSTITLNQFIAHSGIGGAPVRRVFGSWAVALGATGLSQSALGQRYTDEQCRENMLNVWVHYGRPSQHDEMNKAPSAVGSKAYIRRWGTWRKALAAFVAHTNEPVSPTSTVEPDTNLPLELNPLTVKRGSRDVPLALRYYVLKRDRFRCVACGKSPANDPGTVLHIDHIHPWVAGGATVAENLRALCMECNLGKGTSHAEEI